MNNLPGCGNRPFHARVPDRVREIPFSAIRSVFRKACEYERQGKKVIHLEMGRPDFDTPLHIKEAAKKALDDGYVHYTPNEGILPLRETIAKRLSNQNKLMYDPQGEIIVTVGAAEALFVSLISFLEPNDEVIVFEPSWINYFHTAQLIGVKLVFVPLKFSNRFIPDLDDIRKAITPRTRMVLINSPHNPTGVVLSRQVLESICNIACEFNLLVVSDEIYDQFVYDGHEFTSIAALPNMFERTITINSFSKTYSMTGWRIGYIAAQRELCDVMIKVHQYIVTSTNSFAQYGAYTAYEASQDEANKMIEEFALRRSLLLSGLGDLKNLSFVRPQGGFYLFPCIHGLDMDMVKFSNFLLDEVQVAVVPGSAFGPSGAGHFRIAYTSSYEDIEEAILRFKKAWAVLKLE